jgi:hypothetical protein
MNRGLKRRIDEDNHHTIRLVVEQLRSPLGVIPFVGAGMSAAFDFPQWADLIRNAAVKLTRRDRNAVNALLADQDFAAAATRVVASLGPERFQDTVAEQSGDYRVADSQLTTGALALLPLISNGPVITTNLDRNLERAYAAAERPFVQRVYGANPSEVVPALQRNDRVLWKIHGDWKDPRTQVLTDEEYKRRYSRHEQLGNLLRLALTNRPALFLGASLTKDYTVQVLAQIAKDHPRLKHFTVEIAPETQAKFEKRIEQLTRLGVTPLWYVKDHGLVGILLRHASPIYGGQATPSTGPEAHFPSRGQRAAQGRDASSARSPDLACEATLPRHGAVHTAGRTYFSR